MEFLTNNNINVVLEDLNSKLLPNEDQLNALQHLCNFLEDKDSKATVLSGSAGTGKTFCVNLLMQIMKKHYPKYDIVLAAPTHKAKNVLKRFTNNELPASTLHSLLGLKPNVSIADFDAKNIDFLYGFSLDFINMETLYIIDECSMINDKLYDHIIKTLGESQYNKILFIGDSKQLNPVKQLEKSKVFNKTDFPGANLVKVMRQKNESILLDTLTVLRDEVIKKFETKENETEGVKVYSNVKDFMAQVLLKYRDHDFAKEPFAYKVLTYTNKRVKEYNNSIRRLLGRTEPFVVGDVLMGYDNFSCKVDGKVRPQLGQYDGQKKATGYTDEDKDADLNIYNSSDYVILNVKKGFHTIPYFGRVPAYLLKVLDTIDNHEIVFYMLDPQMSPKVYEQLAIVLESIRLSAIDKWAKPFLKKKSWQKWYEMKNSFWSMVDLEYEGRVINKATFDYGYAISIHKSQGSTYQEVFVDANDMHKCPNPEELRSLQYVALSRARNYVHLLQ
jgi:exodeoxyribonuclease-5